MNNSSLIKKFLKKGKATTYLFIFFYSVLKHITITKVHYYTHITPLSLLKGHHAYKLGTLQADTDLKKPFPLVYSHAYNKRSSYTSLILSFWQSSEEVSHVKPKTCDIRSFNFENFDTLRMTS